jgi:hypothetical protein
MRLAAIGSWFARLVGESTAMVVTTGFASEHQAQPGVGFLLTGDDPVANEFRSHLAWWVRDLRPEGAMQCWLAESAADAAWHIRLADVEADQWRSEQADRAEDCWAIDRRAEAVKTAARLSKDPELTVARLRQSLEGCNLLHERLQGLLDRLRTGSPDAPPSPLDESGRTLAFDLLGLRPEQRQVWTVLDPSPGSGSLDDAALVAHQAAVLASALDELERLRTQVHPQLDESRRERTMRRRGTPNDPVIKRIYSQQHRQQRRLEWALNELRALQKAGRRPEQAPPVSPASTPEMEAAFDELRQARSKSKPQPEPQPRPRPAPEPEPQPEPEPAQEPVPPAAEAMEPAVTTANKSPFTPFRPSPDLTSRPTAVTSRPLTRKQRHQMRVEQKRKDRRRR